MIEASSLTPIREIALRSGYGIDVDEAAIWGRVFRTGSDFLEDLQAWLGPFQNSRLSEFEIYRIDEIAAVPR